MQTPPEKQIYKSLLLPLSDVPSKSERRYQLQGLQKTKGTLFVIPPSNELLEEAYSKPPRPRTMMSSGAVALCKHFQRIPDQPGKKRQTTKTTTKSIKSRSGRGKSDDPNGSDDYPPESGTCVHDDNNDDVDDDDNNNEDDDEDEENLNSNDNDKGENYDKHPFWTEPKGSNAAKNEIAWSILQKMLVDCVGVWRNVLFLHRGLAVYEIRNRGGWGMRWTLGIEEDDCKEEEDDDDDDDDDGEENNKEVVEEDSDEKRDNDVDVEHDETGMDLGRNEDDENTLDIASSVRLSSNHKEGQDLVHGKDVEDGARIQDVSTRGKEQRKDMPDDSTNKLRQAEQEQSRTARNLNPNDRQWKITSVTFRGFLEPIDGLGSEVSVILK